MYVFSSSIPIDNKITFHRQNLLSRPLRSSQLHLLHYCTAVRQRMVSLIPPPLFLPHHAGAVCHLYIRVRVSLCRRTYRDLTPDAASTTSSTEPEQLTHFSCPTREQKAMTLRGINIQHAPSTGFPSKHSRRPLPTTRSHYLHFRANAMTPACCDNDAHT